MDVARGLAVLSIVLMHVTVATFTPFTTSPELRGFWERAVDAPWAFHLTSLFILSGMLSATRIRAGFRDRKLRRSVLNIAYLYVLWNVIYTVFASLGFNTWSKTVFEKKSFLIELVLPKNVLWFLLALVVWTLALTALRRVPGYVIIPLLIAVNVASWWFPGIRGQDQYVHVLAYGLFFAVGVYGKDVITRLVEHHTEIAFASSAVVFIATKLAMSIVPGAMTTALVWVPQLLSAALLLLTGSVWIARIPRIGSATSGLGRQTLPVYVLHMPLAAVLAVAPLWSRWTNMPVLSAVLPLVTTAIIVALALWINAAVANSRGRYLFAAPRSRSGSFANVAAV